MSRPHVHRAVVHQQRQQVLRGPHHIRVVTGLQCGLTAREMLEAALSGQGDHPRPHRQVEHRNPGEPSFGPHRQATRDECL